jgi:hypothetical protein
MVAIALTVCLFGATGAAQAQTFTASEDECTGADDVLAFCEERTVGSYCAWVEVLGQEAHDRFCIYWPT